jgi:hypothetical protein
MQEYLKDRLWVHLRRAAMAVLASGAVAATTVHANPPSNMVPVPPADLPASAQKTSEPMFLYDGFDGGALLYAQQNQGARLATFSELVRFQCQDYPAIDTLTAYELSRIFDVKQVRAKMTKGDMATTFMPTDSGLYMIRRPGEEFIHQMMLIPPN